MDAWELLRELSHPTRLEIIHTVAVEARTAEDIAEAVNATAEETSMHLNRLSKSGIIDKEPGGTYRAGPLGQITLWLLPGLDFLASHSEFFKDQELSLLPAEFVSRLGDLRGSERNDGAVSNIQLAERIFQRAGERISVVADEVMLDAVPVIREKVSGGLNFRFVIDENFKSPPDFKPAYPELWRKVSKIPAAVVVTEKEGMVCFLDRELMVDYSVAFRSDEPPFLVWCENLVETLWKEGHRLR